LLNQKLKMSKGGIKKEIRFPEEFVKSPKNIPKEKKWETEEVEIQQDINKKLINKKSK